MSQPFTGVGASTLAEQGEQAFAPAHQTQVAAAPVATTVGTPIAQAAPQFFLPQPPQAQTYAPPAAVPTAPDLFATPPPAPDPTATVISHPDRALRLGQIIWWQTAVVAVGAATAGSRLALILTSLAAFTVILLTAIRFRGQWLYRWAALLAAYLLRRRRADLTGADLTGNGGISLVSLFCGRTSTSTLTIREQPYGLMSRAEGASVALRVGSDAQYEVLPRLTALADSVDEQPVGVSVQLVLHTGVKQGRQPRAWIAVRASRTTDIATDEQLGQVLANTVRRLVRRFDREQVETMPLDQTDALASVGALAHANAGRSHLRERWSSWAAGPIMQISIRLTGFSALEPVTAQALVDTLLGTGTGGAQTLAITVAAAGGGTTEPTRHDAVLRVAAAHPATLDTAVTVLTTLARSFGVDPERLDGRHAQGVAATLPLGVPLS
jgi:type VII secretion protein EccE